MNRIGIFGTSGMAREAGDIAHALGLTPLYIAHSQSDLRSWSFSDEVILEDDLTATNDISFIIGIGDNQVRQKLAHRYLGKLRFSNLIHPSASFGYKQLQAIQSQQGVVICPGVRFTNNIQVGDFTIFNQNSTIAHDVIIEDFVHIAPGCVISGNVHIGQRSWLGAGAIVNQGSNTMRLKIGNDTIIGSGAVVLNSCDDEATYVGIPAKRVRY